MLHEYRNKEIIQAEQVLGRAEAEYYQLSRSWDPMSLNYGEPWFPEDGGTGYLNTKEGPMRVHKGDWIATGINGERWVIPDKVFRKTYERCD